MSDAAEEINATFDDGVDPPAVEQAAPAAPKPPPEQVPEEKEPEKKAVEFTPEQQEKFNAEIARKVAKQREAERQFAEEKARREELERKIAEYEAPVRPDIPPLPDPYDTDYAQRVAYRDAMIAKAAQYDAQQAAIVAQKEHAKRQAWEAEQQRLRDSVQTYSSTAEKLGITAQELAAAGATVAQFGIADDLAKHILADEHGPAITLFLGNNPLELDKVARMSPIQAAIYLETEVKPRAKKPAPVIAPPPIESPKGSGISENEAYLKGVTFD